MVEKRFEMPGGDGTGPFGTGPRWGNCIGAGFRRGRGMGRGAGMGFGRGYGLPFGMDPAAARQALEDRAAVLERELKALRDQLTPKEGE